MLTISIQSDKVSAFVSPTTQKKLWPWCQFTSWKTSRWGRINW